MESVRGGSKKKEKGGGDADKSTINYLIPPWPDWNDNELNSEKWDAVSNATGKSKEKSKQIPTVPITGFSHPMGHGELPKSFKVASWARPMDYKPDGTFTVYDGKVDANVDLVSPNLHLLHSPFMRATVTSISNILRLSYKKPFEVEMESPQFVSTGDKIWQPWYHVYSLCKAGKGQVHHPIVNPAGKYIIRLFYMGTWRRITVDDYLPLDYNGNLLLPQTKGGTELWPMLLTKGLLLIGALTWTENKEIVDFNVTSCLTGWFNYNIYCEGKPYKYIWTICKKLLMADHEDESMRYEGIVPQEITDNYSNFSFSHRMGEIINDATTFAEFEVLGSVVIFGNVADLSTKPEAITGISPCSGHLVMFTEAKAIKHNYDPDRPPTPLWKKFRWKAWALRKGIIQYSPTYEVKSIRVFSSMRNTVAPAPQFESVTDILSPSVMIITEEPSQEDQQKAENSQLNNENTNKKYTKESKKGKDKEISSKKPKDKESASKKTTKSDSKKAPKTPRIVIERLNETPEELDTNEPWYDFEKFLPVLNNLEVFYRPSCFNNSMKITDVSQLVPVEKPITSGKRPQMKEQEVEVGVRKCKKDVFYLYADSIYSKKIFITLCVLPQDKERLYNQIYKLCLKNNSLEEIKESGMVNTSDETYSDHILGEKYNWKSTGIGEEVFSFSTRGTKSIMLQLDEGISVIRVWLKVPTYYSLQIFSQVPFQASTLEIIQENLETLSSSIQFFGEEIMTVFQTLSRANSEGNELAQLLKAFKNSYMPWSFHGGNEEFCHIQNKFEEAMISVLREEVKDLELLHGIIIQLQNLFKNPYFGTSLLEDIQRQQEERKEVPEGKRESLPESEVLPTKPSQEQDTFSGQSKLDDSKNRKGKKSPKKLRSGKEPKSAQKKTSKKDKEASAQSSTDKSIGNIFHKPETFIKILVQMCQSDPQLLKLYPFRSDLDLMLVRADCKGSVTLSPKQYWVPLIRFVINFHQEPVLCAFNFHCILPSYTLVVINNDNHQEIPRSLMEVMPTYYSNNEKGYTVLGYAYTLPGIYDIKQQDITWSLRILAEKQEYLPHCGKHLSAEDNTILDPPKLSLQELKGNYIPNRHNNICRSIVKANRNISVTLRLHLSNPLVGFVFKAKKKDSEDLLIERYGRGEIIIPIFDIDVGSDEIADEMAEFEIEVNVAKKDGWPLTQEEKVLITALREKISTELLVYSSETQKNLLSRQKSNKRTSSVNTQEKPSINEEAPHWTLHLLCELGMANVTLIKDTREHDAVRKLKASWEESDPGRHERSMMIRQQYRVEHESSLALLEEDPSVKKSLTNEKRRLQDTIISQYVEGEYNENSYVLLDDVLEDRLSELNKNYKDFSQIREYYANKLSRFREKQNSQINEMTEKFLTERDESAEIIKSAYDMREVYLNSELEASEQRIRELAQTKKDVKKDRKGIDEKGKKLGKKENDMLQKQNKEKKSKKQKK